jgi:hypothetical protein
MVVVFEGGYSRSEIQSYLDTDVAWYGLDLTDDNYNRVGSALVAAWQTGQEAGCDPSLCGEVALLALHQGDGALHCGDGLQDH